jgi:enamine deaminase RidA (YjgF/YER057c/UK114 family)
MMDNISAKRRRIVVPDIPEPPPGFWSNCYAIGNLVVMAGMVGKDKDNKPIGPGDAYQQSMVAFQRMKMFLEAAGGKMSDIIKLNAFLTDIRDRDHFVKARQQFFKGDFPPCTVVGGTLFAAPDFLVEVDAWAIIGSGD